MPAAASAVEDDWQILLAADLRHLEQLSERRLHVRERIAFHPLVMLIRTEHLSESRQLCEQAMA